MMFVKASESAKRRSQANVLLFYFHVDLNKLYFCVTAVSSDSEILNAAWERLSFSITKYNILKKNLWILSLLHSLLDPVSQLIFIFSWIRRLYLMESWRIVKGKQWQKNWKLDFSLHLIFYQCTLFLHHMILSKCILWQKEVLKHRQGRTKQGKHSVCLW